MNKTLPAFILLLTSCAQVQAQSAKTLRNADYIIRHVNILTMADSNPKNNQCICIDNDKISFIGDDNLDEKLASKAVVIEGSGKYLMPGMAEMHVHLPPPGEIKNFMTLSLMGGVTTVRSMRGKPEHLLLKQPASYPMPHLYLGTPIITRFTPLDEKGADSVVKNYKQSGYDFIKVIDIKDSISFITLMKYARKYDMPVCGHMLYNLKLEDLVKNGYSTIEHLGGYTDVYKDRKADLKNILLATKANNICQCPTEAWYCVFYHQVSENDLQNRIGLQYIPDTIKQSWDKELAKTHTKMGDSAFNAMREKYSITHKAKLDIIRQMADLNIGMVIGSDGGDTYLVPGFSMIEEMKIFKDAGISNYKILQYATIGAAHYFNEDKNWGTVEKGKNANLVLLSANPLDNLDAVTKVEGIFLDKKFLSQKELAASLN